MQWDWPVSVTLHEANAFAAWKNRESVLPQGKTIRVLTELQHVAIRDADRCGGPGTVVDPAQLPNGDVSSYLMY